MIGKHLPLSSPSCLPNPGGHLPLGKQLSWTLWLNPGGHLPVIGSGAHFGESGWKAQPLSGMCVTGGSAGLHGGPPPTTQIPALPPVLLGGLIGFGLLSLEL